MSLWDEWRAHPCTKEYIAHLKDGVQILSETMSELPVNSDLPGEYTKLDGWREGLREAVRHAEDHDED